MPRPVLVSACLLGLCSRYNLEIKSHSRILNLVQKGVFLPVPVCPEQLGGLPTPRPASRFLGGDGRAVLRQTARIVDAHDRDVTASFLRGAEETLKIADLSGCEVAIMKERSPSCGVTCVHVDDSMREGMGLTSALLERKGLVIFSEATFPEKFEPGSNGSGRT